MTETASKDVSVTWAHHAEFNGETIKPGDSSEMSVETARAYAAAGMLTIDPEDGEAMQAIGGPPVVPSSEPSPTSGNYDPTDYSVEQVNAYLNSADDAERERVLAVERGGKNRSTISGV